MTASLHELRAAVLIAWKPHPLVLMVLGVVSLPGGCSCRPTPREPWDAGLRAATTTSSADGSGTGGAGSAGTRDAGSGNSAAAGEAGGGGGGDTGDGQGAAGRDGAGESNSPGRGSDARGEGGNGESGETGGGGPAQSEGSPSEPASAGVDDAPGPGGGTEREPTAGILPGRQAEPELDAAKAIDVAETNLTRAGQLRARRRFAEAYELAARAYDAVHPHVAENAKCKTLATSSLDMLREIAKSLPAPPKQRAAGTTFYE
jgi:hypothetical protein